MTVMSDPHLGQSGQPGSRGRELEYGLHHVAQHNAQQIGQQSYHNTSAIVAGLPSYQEPEPIGLGMSFNNYDPYPEQHQHDAYGQNNESYTYPDIPFHTPPAIQTPPTPRSNNTIEGTRSTRSGRTLRRTDSPMSSDAKVSKPKPRQSKSRRTAKVLPPEFQPHVAFTLMDKDWGGIQLKDMTLRGKMSKEERKAQATKKDGHVSRPMNAFMMYRCAWAERCKAHFNLSNHQYVSQILGASWAMETDDVKAHWKKLSLEESENHKVHLPDYRYQPSKPASKKDRDESDDEEYGLADDPDGEYIPAGRQSRTPRKQPPRSVQKAGAQYTQDMYSYPVHMNIGNWSQEQTRSLALPYAQGQPYPVSEPYMANPQQWSARIEDMRVMNSTPTSNYSSGHGLVGLPGVLCHDLGQSRTQTPLQSYEQSQYEQLQYEQPPFEQTQYEQPQVGENFLDQSGAIYSDRGYQQTVDPNMELNLGHESHFSDALGDLNAPSGLETMPQHDVWLDPALNNDPQTEYSFALAD